MVEAARAMKLGGSAIGTTKPHIPHASISSYEGVVPKSSDWRTLNMGGDAAPAKERVA
jgi:phthalate 4,5-dioxygenase oxygenase subunit